jgi:hypothetical protein
MSIIGAFRKLSYPSRKVATIWIICLGIIVVSPGVIVFLEPKDSFDLTYIRGHGGYKMPIASLILGLVILIFGIRRIFIK